MNDSIYWIVEYGATLTEFFLCSTFCQTFIENANLNQNFYKRFIISNIATILMLLVNSIELYSPISVMCALLIMSFMQFILYSKSPIKTIVLGILFLTIISAIDNVVASTASYTLEIPISELYQKMSLYRVLLIIISKTMLLLFVLIINKFFSKKKIIQRKYLFVLFIMTMIMMILIVFITFMDIKNNSINSYISILFFATMLIMLLIIFFGIFKLAEYYENQQQLKLTKLKNQMLEQSMTETKQTFMLWKTSIHDFKHNIATLMKMIENNDIHSIKDYLEHEYDLLSKQLFYYKTGNDTVDIILNMKQKLAEHKGITFVINAEVPEHCNISCMDFASLLGNLLDNAIEASEKEKNPFIEVIMKFIKNYLIINISNKYTGSKNDLETTKSDKHLHGIGIRSIKQTVKKYDGEFSIEIANAIFQVKIMIPI